MKAIQLFQFLVLAVLLSGCFSSSSNDLPPDQGDGFSQTSKGPSGRPVPVPAHASPGPFLTFSASPLPFLNTPVNPSPLPSPTKTSVVQSDPPSIVNLGPPGNCPIDPPAPYPALDYSTCNLSDSVFQSLLTADQLYLALIHPTGAPTEKMNGSSVQVDRKLLTQAGQIGSDALDINQYFNEHPEAAQFQDLFSAPSTGESISRVFLDSHGNPRSVRLHGKRSMMRAFANSIRHVRVRLPSSRMRSQMKAARSVPSTCDASQNSLPTILCQSSAIGNGKGWDTDIWAPSTYSTPFQNSTKNGLVAQCNFALKSSLSCVKDQGNRGTCTAFSAVGAIEALVRSTYNLTVDVNLSEQALYFQEKAVWDSGGGNSDSAGFDPMELAAYAISSKYIIPYESQWDYNPSYCLNSNDDSNSCNNNCEMPTDGSPVSHYFGSFYPEYCSDNESQGQFAMDSQSGQFGYLSYVSNPNKGVQITSYQSLWTGPSNGGVDDFGNPIIESAPINDISAVINALNQKIPVIASIWVTKGFMYSMNGAVPDPVNSKDFIDDTSRTPFGGHAILIVGFIPVSQITPAMAYPYSISRASPNTAGIFILKNSWGPSAGDAGYYYVSDQFLIKAGVEFVAINQVSFKQ